MQEVVVSTLVEFDAIVPEPDVLVVSHEWGNVEEFENVYEWTPKSIGVHKLVWKANDSVVATEFRDVFMPIVTESELDSLFPSLSLSTEEYTIVERAIRHKIQNYCGQKFGPYVDEVLEVQGTDGDALSLPVAVLSLDSLEDSFGSDITDYVMVSPGISSIISTKPGYAPAFKTTKADLSFVMKNIFRSEQTYIIEGSFGWEYVPNEVVEAAAVLINDVFTDDTSGQIKKGIVETQLADFKLKFNADRWGSTGNADADNLLSAYANFGIGMV